MNEPIYLALGFALLSFFLGRERPRKARAPWIFSLKLSFAVGMLMTIDRVMSFYLWDPIGRSDLRFMNLFLWSLVIDSMIGGKESRRRGKAEIRLTVSRFLPPLLGFSLWLAAEDATASFGRLFMTGLFFPLTVGFLEWLLSGLWERTRLAAVPRRLEGTPMLFWLAMLLGLVFSGLFRGAAGLFVN